ncbi:MAG: hypothetical protein GX941_10325, partial [Candidatus Methanofastidiosa archaeon]|nr:hypothetical protein [Candidatus Methanofastidiosa archaeon]
MFYLYPIPILIYALIAFGFLFFAKENKLLKAILVTSYCGVMVITFTRGASGAVYLIHFFIYLTAWIALSRPKLPQWESRSITIMTYLLCAIFIIGILVGILRYDSSLEMVKMGTFQRFGGIPANYLMAGYRFFIVLALILAFTIPLHYAITREALIEMLNICWFFTIVLAILGIIHFMGIADMGFDYRTEDGYKNVAVLGFHRASNALMLDTGLFLSIILSQITPNVSRKNAIYLTIPIILTGILVSFSRAGFLALFVSTCSIALIFGSRGMIRNLIIGTLLVTFLLGIIWMTPSLRQRFDMLTDEAGDVSSNARFRSWEVLGSLYLKHPDIVIFGVGFQNFQYYLSIIKGEHFLEA